MKTSSDSMATKDRRGDKVIPAMSQEALKNREAVMVKAGDRLVNI